MNRSEKLEELRKVLAEVSIMADGKSKTSDMIEDIYYTSYLEIYKTLQKEIRELDNK
jgi:protein-tyrosine-phosphatase